jgi:nickel-dependent lactate racemase
MAVGKGSPDSSLSESDIRGIVVQGIPRSMVSGKKILVLTPDSTRTAPLPLMVKILIETTAPHAARLDFMVALGTHQLMSEDKIFSLYGMSGKGRADLPPNVAFMNHRWDLPDQLRKIGTIRSDEIEGLTGGLFKEDIDVSINRGVFDYDMILILGPVFPHEVVGFSGGNKYLFPGISGGDFLHFFHWLGAVITCWKTIGFKNTPTRAVVDRAASMVSVPRWCLAMVVNSSGGLSGLYAGTAEDAWSAAADLSTKIHIVYKPKPFHTVLGRAAEMYDELWVGGKVMYKLEPVVADGGKLIIYGPWIKEVSWTWGREIERIGYHVRDYFLSRMNEWRDVPRGVLAHSTHVRGVGTFIDGKETPRIDVILATGISEEVCRRINLGYMNPAMIRVNDYENQESEGVLFVDHAGEVLHRLEHERIMRSS